MSRTTSLIVRRLAVMASALVAMTACRDEGPVQPMAPNGSASAPIKVPKPQFLFNGIVFSGTQDVASGELYAMNPDGTNVFRLTFDNASDSRPDLSSKGTLIWDRREANTVIDELYTMNMDGTNRKQLTHFGGQLAYPRYSPDGSKIVFSRWLSYGPELFLMNADGTNLEQLTSLHARASFPSWSPDGKKIAFQADNGGGVESIWTMNADGSNQSILMTCAFPGCVRPRWNPVANEIAAERVDLGEIFVIDATTGLQVAYVPNPNHDMEVTWTKDGTQVIFSSLRGNNGGADLFMTTPMRGPVSGPPPVVHLTSFIGNEWSATVSK